MTKIDAELKLKLFSNGISKFYILLLVLGPWMWRDNIWVVIGEGASEDMHNEAILVVT